MTECDALLILNAVPGLGSIRIKNLCETFGTALNVLALNEIELASHGQLPQQTLANLIRFPREQFLEDEQRLIARNQASVILKNSDDYPPQLKQIPDAPILLYVKGRIPNNHELFLAIVGSRMASFYGLSTATHFAARLSAMGFTIISGMARGIDTAAHRGCLQSKGATIAVLGCGLEHVYPPENESLMDQIAENGAVISEFPMAVPPLSQNFPRRNRIISGLSYGVIVIEAAKKSGALITAHCAGEQGRDVFAIPGKIDNPYSSGVNNLIKEGAKLTTCVEDVIEELKPHIQSYVNQQTNMEKNDEHSPEGYLEGEEKNIYRYIKDEPLGIDILSEISQLSVSSLSSVLLKLELKGLIRQLPGKLFVR